MELSGQAEQAEALRLRLLQVADPMMNGEEAFRMLVPADWRVEGLEERALANLLDHEHELTGHSGLSAKFWRESSCAYVNQLNRRTL